MTDHLPAVLQASALVVPPDTYSVPALIADAGAQAGWRYVEFFTANINNPHTRRAYARACARFFAWCEQRGLTLAAIRPFDVAAWVNTLQETHGAPGVKQQLAAVRMLFNWLITGQVTPFNPASAVRGPKHVVKTGKTPALDGKDWRKLVDAIPTETVRDLRDRALIATLTSSFARIGAAPGDAAHIRRSQRTELNPALSSWVRYSGCSKAAKWPPLGSRLKWMSLG